MIDQLRPGNTYLRDTQLRQWLLTGEGTDNNFDRKTLQGINLEEAKLRNASFIGADLSGANLQNADLSRARLLETQLEETNLTGATIEDWSINNQTIIDNVICDYVYLKECQQERRPAIGNFAPGEFATLVRKTIETVDLIFKDGIDWQAFLSSFQNLQVECGSDELTIQSFEDKGDGAFVIRVNVPRSVDKAEIERYLKRQYQLEAQLEAKSEQLANLMEITKLLAGRPTQSYIGVTALSKSESMSEASRQEQGSKNYTIQGDNIQAVQGDKNVVWQQKQNVSAQEELTQEQVAELLAEIKQKISSSALPEAIQEKAIKRLDAAADEVQEKEPDRQLAAGNLKRMGETLAEASKTSEEAKKLWDNVQPILVQVAGWLRVAVDYLLDNLL